MGTMTRTSVEPPRPARGSSTRAESASDASGAEADELLQDNGLGLFRWSSDGTVLWASRSEYESAGYQADEYVGHNAREFHREPQLIDTAFERLLAGEKVRGLASTLHCRDGSTRAVTLSASARFDEQGRIVDVRGVRQDVAERTSQVRVSAEEERFALLARASEQLTQSLDYERTLATLLDLAVPRLGDFAFLDVREDDEVRRLTRTLDDGPSVAGCTWNGVGEPRNANALHTGESALHAHIDADWLGDIVAADQRVLLEQLGVGSMITVPVALRGQTLAALSLFFTSDQRKHDENDLALAEELARRAAVAIVNARQYKEARDAIGIRDDFLSLAGHELRTPLTALQLQILSITKMAGQPENAEKVAVRADKAGRNVLRLSGLVNELLDISRISSGRLKLERGAMDLADAVRDVLHRNVDELAKHDCEVRFTAAGDTNGNWDRVRIEQIASNLVINAMKSGKGKPIDVRVQREENAARLTVRDRGEPISPEDQQRIYQRFERAVSSRQFGGLGLGLWIARELVDAHGGSIRIENSASGGTIFEIVLPLTPPTANPEALA